MRPRLVVRLPSDTEQPPRWLALDAQGRPEGESRADGLDALAAAARGRQVLGLADGLATLLTSAVIPTQSRQRLQRAVPYALEDHLTSDLETLHFALGERDANGRLWVVVSERRWLEDWLERTKEAGFELEQVFPEVLALPLHKGAWTVLVEEQRFLVRCGVQSGFAGDSDNLAPLLEAALAQTENDPPARLSIYHTPGARPELPDVAPEIELHSLVDPTALLAEHLDIRRAIALRSGALARSSGLRAHWRRWRVAAILVLALVGLETGRAWVERWSLASESAALDERMTAVFREAFPGASVPLYPREQMTQRLNALRRGGEASATGFLAALERVAGRLGEAQGVELTALSFRGNGLEIELYADSLQRIDGLRQRLAADGGLQVEVRSAQSDGDRVQGRLLIEVAS